MRTGAGFAHAINEAGDATGMIYTTDGLAHASGARPVPASAKGRRPAADGDGCTDAHLTTRPTAAAY
jgi:hypothetical protein